jgi:hypothetical protein
MNMKDMIKALLMMIPAVLLMVIPIVYGSEITVLNYTAINNIQDETGHGIGYTDVQESRECFDRCGDN